MKIKNNILFGLLFILSSIQSFAEISTFASNLNFSNITSSSITLNWTVGGGTKRMVIARKNALPEITTSTPTFNSTYIPNSNFTLGESLALGKVVYFGTGSTVTVTGLDASSSYYFSIIEVEETPFIYYATNEVDTWKLDGNASTNSGSSISAPTIGATNLNFTAVGQNSLNLNWVSGNGTARIVIARKGSEMNTNPTNNTDYTANSVFGEGSALGGGFVVYNGTGNSLNITGLDSASTYYFTVIEYVIGSETITYASSLRTTSSTTTDGSSSSTSDSDEDGVPDEEDDFPNNANMAFSTGYPAAGYGTMLFEDLWPGRGDYDFNDLVLNYHYDVVSDANDNVVEVKYSFVTRAIGGSLHNGFAFQLDGIPASRIHSVERVGSSKVTGISYATFNDNGTEANQTNANIIVFKDAYDLLPHSSGFAFINVEAGAPNEGTDTTQIIVRFSSNGIRPEGSTATAIADFTHSIFNPYLIVGQERGKEVHKANRVPSSLVNNNYFGQHQDNSNPAQNVYYRTSSGLPWVLDVNESVPYATEKTDFTEAFLKFAEWATSGGSSFTDWYQDLSNYRNTNKIFSGN